MEVLLTVIAYTIFIIVLILISSIITHNTKH